MQVYGVEALWARVLEGVSSAYLAFFSYFFIND